MEILGPLAFTLVAFGASAGAGLLGSLLGLGGGAIIVPFLTLVLDVDIRIAIGASIIAVIATSSGAAAAYVRDGLSNIRVAMFLEVATVIGALGGAFIAGLISGRALSIVFGTVLILSAIGMLRTRHEADDPVPPDRLSDHLELHGSYHDGSRDEIVHYRVTRAPFGFAAMTVAGALSGLLGIGGGAFKVPAMDIGMRLPTKVSTATSNFMMGATAAASAGVYFVRGDIVPFVAAPVALGVLVGALVGARVLPRLNNAVVKVLFVIALSVIGIQMIGSGT